MTAPGAQVCSSYTPPAASLHHSITPSLHHSITPSLHHSITPPLHHSITPSLHHSITPSLHHSTTPSLHYSITPLLLTPSTGFRFIANASLLQPPRKSRYYLLATYTGLPRHQFARQHAFPGHRRLGVVPNRGSTGQRRCESGQQNDADHRRQAPPALKTRAFLEVRFHGL